MANRLGPIVVESRPATGRSDPHRPVRPFALLVDRVNALEPELEPLHGRRAEGQSPTQLRLKAKQGDSLNSLLVEAFALVRESAKRTIGQRHFDVQILGGIAIHNRCIAELETGEGKTLVATMPTFLNALPGKGVHVVTVNDYLARRDAEWMTPIYQMLGLTVGCIQTGQTDGSRRAAYACDITYGTGQGARLRLPPRRAQAAQAGRRRPPQVASSRSSSARGEHARVREARPAHPLLRGRGRGRQHPDRRGADAR